MLESFGENPERQGLDAGDGFVASSAIAEHARKIGNLSDPTTVVLTVKVDAKGDAHRTNSTTGRMALPNNAMHPTGAGGMVNAGG